jgi:methionyl-tRNA synthetase
MKKFFITTPIYYPNARPHVGSAYTTIVCDVLARYKRMCGYDVAFLTGTDEHGEKLERAAAAAGQSPSEFVAEKRKLFVQLWEKLGVPVKVYPESDQDSLRFIYTTHPDHVISVQRMLKLAHKNSPGVIYKGKYEGRYCVSDERYISDGSEPANCDICGRPAELISEENYFFKLSAYQERLLELYEKHPEFVQPDFRRNEVTSFVKSGLRDISVSRKRIKWGIPWPGDPGQVFYVWYDALTSYLTGIGYAQGENGGPDFQKYWMDPEGEVVHMIGKDILRFHAVYWPAFIMAAYPDQPEMLPTTVFAHGWIYYDQDKMSKSKGNVVYPEPIIAALDSFGAPGNDALRYYLLADTPFGLDASFSYEGLIDRFNFDLANDFGNLVSRTIGMIHRYFDGFVPRPPENFKDPMLPLIEKHFQEGIRSFYMGRMGNFNLSHGVGWVQDLIGELNRYLTTMQPWLGKDDFRRASLYGAADGIRIAAVLLAPFMPASAQRAWEQLGCEESLGKIEDQRIDQLKWGDLKPGTKVGKPEPIFPRLDKEKTLAKLDEFSERDRERAKSTVGALREAPLQANLAGADRNRDKPKEALKSVQKDRSQESGAKSQEPGDRSKSQEPAPGIAYESRTPNRESRTPSPESRISIEDFAKVDMRTGEIKAAERVPGATKLLKLQVDIGSEVRQVVAGIAEYYEPEKLIGMKVVLVVNLQPRKLRGVESNGMIVAASIGEEGRPVLVTFKEDVPNGARLK